MPGVTLSTPVGKVCTPTIEPKQVKKILDRASTLSLEILNEKTSPSISGQTKVVHHHYHSNPFWWWLFTPSVNQHHHYHYPDARASQNKKKDDTLLLIGGIGLLLGATYFLAGDISTTRSLQKAIRKMDKDEGRLSLLPQDNATVQKVQRVLRKERHIVERIKSYTNWALCGKSGLAASGAAAIGGYFLASNPLFWLAGGGTLAASMLLLYNWGSSGDATKENIEDARKIQEELPKLKKEVKHFFKETSVEATESESNTECVTISPMELSRKESSSSDSTSSTSS